MNLDPRRSGWMRWSAAAAAVVGTLLWRRRRRSAAMPLLERSLEARDQLLDTSERLIADPEALLALEPGGADESLELLARAAERLEHRRRSVSDELTTSLGTLARIYRRRGDHERAEGALRQLLAVLRPLPSSDPAVVTALADLADTVQRLDRPAEAERLWRRVATLHEQRATRDVTAIAEAHWRAAECEAMLEGQAGAPAQPLRLAR